MMMIMWLLYFYLTVIRPVLEYGCVVHRGLGLTVVQSKKLESLQKRALRIIHPIVYDMPYDSACEYVGVQSLSARRSDLGRRFFRSVTVSDSCLHDLLPQGRDSEILSRLRRHTVYPIPQTKIVLSYTMHCIVIWSYKAVSRTRLLNCCVLLFLPHWLWSFHLFLFTVFLLAIRLPCFNKLESSWVELRMMMVMMQR